MANVKWAVVIPTIRPEKLAEFLVAWNDLFVKHEVHLVIIHDHPELPSTIPLFPDDSFTVTQMSRKDVPDFVPVQTDMIRSWGFFYAWKVVKPEYVLTLDDDVKPMGDVFAEYERVFEEGAPLSNYLSVGALTSSNLEMRGFPYRDRVKREVAVQYGGWDGVLDYDAATQLARPMSDQTFKQIVLPVPKGVPATCCIMNAAWRVEYTPIMWQLPMLDRRFNRVGDIWSGLFIKRVLDCIGSVMVINGSAKVQHDRASDPYVSLQREAPSVYLNDYLWDELAKTLPLETKMYAAYKEVTDAAYEMFLQYDEEYAEHFIGARNKWLDLFVNS